MPKVVYVQADGSRAEVEVPAGDSVMDGALDNGVPGILGQCGGGCTCSTCHCFIDERWRSKLPPAHPDELDLLAYLPNRTDASRLACQITVSDELDGLVVRLPAEQV